MEKRSAVESTFSGEEPGGKSTKTGKKKIEEKKNQVLRKTSKADLTWKRRERLQSRENIPVKDTTSRKKKRLGAVQTSRKKSTTKEDHAEVFVGKTSRGMSTLQIHTGLAYDLGGTH